MFFACYKADASIKDIAAKKQPKGSCNAAKSVVNCLTKNNNQQKDYDYETNLQI